MFAPADSLFRPKSVAIIGASDSSRGGWAKAIYANLEHCGFPAKVYLINPKRTELWGRPVYPNFAAIPEPVDLALTIIPPSTIPDTLREAADHGLKCALIFAAQFGETGDAEGVARAKSLKALCEAGGLRISGPNCMGAVSVREKLLLYPSARVRALQPGSIGVVFQSGGTFQFWLQQAATRGLGFSYAASSGNELDLDLADYINFLVEDDSTKVIACMIEGIRRPAAFMAVAERALAVGKPIVVVKVGRSAAAREAATSHTGAIAGDDQVFDAMCRKYGILRCHTLDDMIETCVALSQGRVPKGRRIAMVGYSGGAKGLFLDYASEEGASLATFTSETRDTVAKLVDPGLPPDNPLDVGAGAGVQGTTFSEICRNVCTDPNVDLVCLQGLLPLEAGDRYDAAPLASVAASTGKPVVAFLRNAQNMSDLSRKFQQDTGVPFVQGLSQTVRVLQQLAGYGEVQRRGMRGIGPMTGSQANLDGECFAKLLQEHGVTAPRSGTAPSPEGAAECASAIGFPVAVKIISPDASHKTEVGGVTLNLRDPTSVRAAAEDMQRRLVSLHPGAHIEGFMVQEMVDGLEMIIGVREDPLYGPFMLVGLGGILVEALKDVSIRLLPIDEDMAHEMLESLRASVLLKSFRGRESRDIEGAARAIVGLSQIFADHRAWLSDIEVNPLILLPQGQGVRAVDVRMTRRPAE